MGRVHLHPQLLPIVGYNGGGVGPLQPAGHVGDPTVGRFGTPNPHAGSAPARVAVVVTIHMRPERWLSADSG
jgi:hypothetical protein